MKKRKIKHRHNDAKTEVAKKTSIRADAFVNFDTRINYGGRAGASKWCVTEKYSLTQNLLDSMYSKEGICKRIIDIYPEEALRAFIDADVRVLEDLDRLKVKSKIFEAARDARLFGGSVIVAFVKDGKSLEEELDYLDIDELVHIKVFDRYVVSWDPADIILDYEDEDFGSPEYYTITNNYNSTLFRVHKSRVFRFAGDTTTDYAKKNNEGWDNSCIVSLYAALRSFGESIGVTAEVVQGYLESTLMIPNYIESFGDTTQAEYLRKRIYSFNSSKGAFNTIMLSQDEKYEKHTTNVNGLVGILDKFAEIISAISSIPISVLFGRQNAGLNATGQAELDLINKKVEQYRNTHIKPFFVWIFKILEAQKSLSVKNAKEPLDFHWEFHPLVTLDEQKEAETRKLNAEVDMMYVNAGALTAFTAWKARYHAGLPFNNNVIYSEQELLDIENELKQQSELTLDDKKLLDDLEQERSDKAKKQLNSDIKDIEMNSDSSKDDLTLQSVEVTDLLMNKLIEELKK